MINKNKEKIKRRIYREKLINPGLRSRNKIWEIFRLGVEAPVETLFSVVFVNNCN